MQSSSFFLISLDEDSRFKNWKQALIGDKISEKVNYFKLINPTKNPLFNDFKVAQIPRYIVINENGQFVDTDFFMPSDPNFSKKLNDLIDTTKK